MKNKNVHLIGSCGSLEHMAELIGKHFYWKEPAVLLANNDDTWSVIFPSSSPRAGMKLKSVIVRKKKNRIRFERI